MNHLIQQIDALLPQTQCGQCGYGGCLPYAQAIATQAEAINRCPPGGLQTLVALGKLLNQDVAPLTAEMIAQQTPPQLAKIREAECIGCTKCIQACPVDAIIGAGKQLHTILASECTGCGLCVAPCPVDCIDMIPAAHLQYQPEKARQRFQAKQQRKAIKLEANVMDKPSLNTIAPAEDKKAYIQAAILRAKAKKF